jgi:hypothetical protein
MSKETHILSESTDKLVVPSGNNRNEKDQPLDLLLLTGNNGQRERASPNGW